MLVKKRMEKKDNKDWNIINSIHSPKDGYIPIIHRNIYKKFAEKCKWFRKALNDDLFGWCVNKKVWNLTEFRSLNNVDIDLPCSNQCPFFIIEKKKRVVWVHYKKWLKIVGKNSPDFNDRKWNGVDKPKGHHIVIGFINKKWKITTYMYCKLNNLMFVKYDKRTYSKLVKKV